jgi:hypothetical protein
VTTPSRSGARSRHPRAAARSHRLVGAVLGAIIAIGAPVAASASVVPAARMSVSATSMASPTAARRHSTTVFTLAKQRVILKNISSGRTAREMKALSPKGCWTVLLSSSPGAGLLWFTIKCTGPTLNKTQVAKARKMVARATGKRLRRVDVRVL